MTQLAYRDATPADLPAIVAIYNSTVASRRVTADTEPVTVDSRRAWFDAHNPHARPLWVVEEAGRVIAWLSFSDFYGRPAYGHTAEISIYLDEAARGSGLGSRLLEAARAKGVMVAFEAAVAGGIPIIKALREGLTANRIQYIAGIINGTTNYILSEMRERGLDFATALKAAQELGYAEADPTFDIEGVDAAHKATIMSAIAFGVPVQFDRAYVEGISRLAATDIKYAEELGYRIKLLGITRRTERGIELRVHPTLIPAKRLLANVEGAMNAVVVHGDAVGTTLYYGKGAGAEPTASAVVADLVDVTRVHTADPEHRVPHLAFQPDSLSNTPILPIEEVTSGYYLRLRVADQTGVLADITRILAESGISIDALLQKESEQVDDANGETDIILITHETVEKNVNAAIARIESLATVVSKVTKLRMEALN